MNKYEKWINKNYPNKKSCINKSNEAIFNLALAFKELTMQVGYANDVYHCWCKDKNGNIIDPTDKQFGKDIKYTLIPDRPLKKWKIEVSTGALFLGNGFKL